jgi:hypothetical protein
MTGLLGSPVSRDNLSYALNLFLNNTARGADKLSEERRVETAALRPGRHDTAKL